MKLAKLYGLDSKGGTKLWEIEATETGYTVRHGKLGGKMQVKDKLVKAKNIGRANETTVTEQGLKEAKSKWQKQVDKGYAEDILSCKEVQNPMLAMDYLKAGHRIDYTHTEGVYVQPKLDGVRCEAYLDDTSSIKLKSRGGKFYPVPEHLVDDFAAIFARHPKIHLDGELYIHGEYLQDIVSAVKKPNNLTPKLSFYCFDIAGMGEDAIWSVRRGHIEHFKTHFTTTNIEFVRDFLVTCFDEVDTYHDMFVKQGYEGVMVRQGFGEYVYNYRSPWLQKYKKFIDKEFTIIKIEMYEDGGLKLGKPVYLSESGIEFTATLKSTVQDKQYLIQHESDYIGLQGTVKYFALTKAGVPQFPITVAIRNYE